MKLQKKRQKIKNHKIKNISLPAGFEPATFRLTAERSASWAMGATWKTRSNQFIIYSYKNWTSMCYLKCNETKQYQTLTKKKKRFYERCSESAASSCCFTNNSNFSRSAPTNSVIFRFFLKKWNVGIEDTPQSWAISGIFSISSV